MSFYISLTKTRDSDITHFLYRKPFPKTKSDILYVQNRGNLLIHNSNFLFKYEPGAKVSGYTFVHFYKKIPAWF